jgi:hypothetical protein
MNASSWKLVAGLGLSALLSGCAASSIESRIRERAVAYAGLPSEQKAAVNLGQIRHGMDADAAYIAWGKPSEIRSDGAVTTWLYREQRLQEHQSITIYEARARSGSAIVPEETRVLYPHEVLRAKIIFENGRIKEWQRDGKAFKFP